MKVGVGKGTHLQEISEVDTLSIGPDILIWQLDTGECRIGFNGDARIFAGYEGEFIIEFKGE